MAYLPGPSTSVMERDLRTVLGLWNLWEGKNRWLLNYEPVNFNKVDAWSKCG